MKDKHGKNFKVFNMSGRTYDFAKFEGKVENFQWQDHHSPALHILFEACLSMFNFLIGNFSIWYQITWLPENAQNVLVVHCNAGKGRTGTVICCFLIFSGLCENAKDAITYYGWKRFLHGKGVTQPS